MKSIKSYFNISIRTRILILTVLSVLPAMLIIVYNGIKHRKHVIESETANIMRIVESLSNIQETITISTKQMLITLAQFFEVKNKNIEACNKLFADVIKNTPFHNTIIEAGLNGNVFACGIPFKPFSVSDRKNFKEVLKNKEFSAGEYIIGRSINAPVLSFAHPVLDDNKNLQAVVLTGFKLDMYENFINKYMLPKDSVLIINDHKGITLYHFPRSSDELSNDIIGKPIIKEHWFNMDKNSDIGNYLAKGIDGMKRIYGYKKLRLKKDEKPYLYIRIGIPENYILNAPNNELKLNMLMLALAFISALLGAWLVGNLSIVIRLKKLVKAVEKLGEGGFDVKTNLTYESGGEIGKLAQSFDIMSDALKKREKEQKRIEEQLRQAQKMEAIGKLAGGIAHDFNNILTPIIGFAEIILIKIKKDDANKKYVEIILKAAMRAKDLINQILIFSRKSEQKLSLIEISLIINETENFMRASLPSNIEIRAYVSSDAVSSKIYADSTQIHQILINLCTNAGHSMTEKGGLLEIKLSKVKLDYDFTAKYDNIKPGQYLKLVVSDTGHGMDENIKAHIFEPYFTTKAMGKGTGMGLSVVYGIVKSYNGLISVYSEPEKGTTFTVFFPIEINKDDDSKNEFIKQPILKGTGRVLIVDDETYIIEMEEEILKKLGYEVVSSLSSIEALKIFASNPQNFDLVITDQTMPNITGHELSKEILKIRPDIPIMLCTGFSDIINEESAKKLGIKEYITKPIIISEFAQKISKIIKN